MGASAVGGGYTAGAEKVSSFDADKVLAALSEINGWFLDTSKKRPSLLPVSSDSKPAFVVRFVGGKPNLYVGSLLPTLSSIMTVYFTPAMHLLPLEIITDSVITRYNFMESGEQPVQLIYDRDTANGTKRYISDNSLTLPIQMPLISPASATYIITASAGTNGTVSGGGSYNHGANLTLTATPNTGYAFDGWYNGSTRVSANTTYSFSATANLTLQARFNPISYTITYNNLNGATNNNPTSYTYGTAITLVNPGTRIGYAFDGYFDNMTGGNKVTDISSTSTGNKILYARWSANTYAITYNANGGSGAPSSQTKTHGITLTLSNDIPYRADYVFLGWSTSSAATTASYQPGASYTENTASILYAVWYSGIHTHSFTNYVSDNNAICTSDGTKTAVCNNGCGSKSTIVDSGSKKSHVYGEWRIGTHASCKSTGLEYRNCASCFVEETRTIPRISHSCQWVSNTPATCMSTGLEEYKCSSCGTITDNRQIARKEHSFGTWTIEVPATATSIGREVRVCNNWGCEEKDYRDIPKPIDEGIHTKSDAVFVDGTNILFSQGMRLADFLNNFYNTGIVLYDKDNNPLKNDSPVGSGATLVLENGKMYTIILLGDINGDGSVSASDARSALRASAKLETLNGWQYIAADINSDGNVSASDARGILRVSAKLDSPDTWLTKIK